jgi:hypothetical protein
MSLVRAKDASSEESSPLEFTELDESFRFLHADDEPLPFTSLLLWFCATKQKQKKTRFHEYMSFKLLLETLREKGGD